MYYRLRRRTHWKPLIQVKVLNSFLLCCNLSFIMLFLWKALHWHFLSCVYRSNTIYVFSKHWRIGIGKKRLLLLGNFDIFCTVNYESSIAVNQYNLELIATNNNVPIFHLVGWITRTLGVKLPRKFSSSYYYYSVFTDMYRVTY